MISFRNLGRLGRWGNQLFQYGATRLYAELNGFSFAFPRWDGDELLVLPAASSALQHLLPTYQADDLNTRTPASRIGEPFGLWRKGPMADLWKSPRDNLNLYGYLQDDATLAMLRGHRDLVRGWLSFRPEIDTLMRAATDRYRPWTAVHVRRGDLMQGNRRTVPLESYRSVLPQVRNGNLFVASDDPSVASSFGDSFSISYGDIGIPPWVADFWLMKEASALIAGGSTYAWWAAFLGNADYWAPPLSHTWPKTYLPTSELRSP